MFLRNDDVTTQTLLNELFICMLYCIQGLRVLQHESCHIVSRKEKRKENVSK